MNNDTQQQHTRAGTTTPPPPPSAADRATTRHSPARAALCAFIPGIGAVYNQEYMKAILHFSIFAGLVLIAEEVGIFSLAAVAFYIFSIIDAYRSAEVIAHSKSFAPQSTQTQEINMPLWGGVLILMGVVFLLDNLGLIHFRSIVQFWPLLFIFLGIYLILDYRRKSDSGNRPPRSSSGGDSYSSGQAPNSGATAPPEGERH